MKKYLIEPKKYYKANLHTHTTKSDGSMTPEEVKQAYIKKGYSIVAYTDHTYIEDFNAYLSDENFIALNAYENCIRPVERLEDYNGAETPIYHFNFFAPDEKTIVMHGINRLDLERWTNDQNREERKNLLFNKTYSPVNYSVSSINRMIKEASDNGFLVQYNHPTWSLQSYKDYIWLKGLWGVEVYNHECYVTGYNDFNQHVLDDLARVGEGVCAVANDDSHGWGSIGGGFTYIGANEFTYKGVIDAMKRKDIYASMGPTFDYIYVEDNKVYVKTSPVVKITMSTDTRYVGTTRFDADEKTQTIDNTKTGTEAVFDINKNANYIRFEIKDINGNYAWTRVFFVDELK